jgi:hypothetical protein
MAHYKSMYDRNYLYSFDLGDRDVVVENREGRAGQATAAGHDQDYEEAGGVLPGS